MKVDSSALDEAKAIGLFGNLEERLIRMARAAVPFTHPIANKRFEGFLLRVDGSVIKRVMRFKPEDAAYRAVHNEEVKVRRAAKKVARIMSKDKADPPPTRGVSVTRSSYAEEYKRRNARPKK